MSIKLLTSLSVSALIAVTMLPAANAHDGGYVNDVSGKAVTDGSGKCLRSASGNHFDGCGAEKPAPVAVVKPAPAPKPVIAKPAPKPVVAAPKPAPAPQVQVLNLNESGGSNFASGSATISSKGKAVLSTFASKVINSQVKPASIKIVGHTDNVGSVASNKRLSVQRAQAVANFLVSKGLDRSVMHVSGQGESRPVANNKSKAGRAQNRRVAISVRG